MSRQANVQEKSLFDIIKEFNHRFYYEEILKWIEGDHYKIKVEKRKEEMVGRASVILQNGDTIDYEIRYNRIMNLRDGYTLLVPGLQIGYDSKEMSKI